MPAARTGPMKTDLLEQFCAAREALEKSATALERKGARAAEAQLRALQTIYDQLIAGLAEMAEKESTPPSEPQRAPNPSRE
jgi:hypothetical protein